MNHSSGNTFRLIIVFLISRNPMPTTSSSILTQPLSLNYSFLMIDIFSHLYLYAFLIYIKTEPVPAGILCLWTTPIQLLLSDIPAINFKIDVIIGSSISIVLKYLYTQDLCSAHQQQKGDPVDTDNPPRIINHSVLIFSSRNYIVYSSVC